MPGLKSGRNDLMDSKVDTAADVTSAPHMMSDEDPTSLLSSASVMPSATSGRTSSMSDFLIQLETYTPTIPDSVTACHLNSAGLEASDLRIIRTISLATQKFICDIANDSMQRCRLRSETKRNKKAKDKHCVLTMADITPVLNERGITVEKPAYFM